MSDGQRFYSDDEAQEILRLAAKHNDPPGAMSRDTLLQSAAELGIAPEAVAAAEKQWKESRALQQDEVEFRKRQRRNFINDLWSYLFVNGFMLAINLMTGSEYLWCLWVMLAWGLGLLFHFRSAFFASSEEYQKELARWRRRRRRAMERGTEIDEDNPRSGLVVGVHYGGNRARPGSAELDDIIADSIEARGGDSKMDIIRDVRKATGMDLSSSRDAVEEYLDREVRQRNQLGT